jgi:hypothetical protein
VAVNVDDIDLIAARTADAYKEAELQILGIIKHHLERGIDSPTWADTRLAAVVSLRRAAEAVIKRLATGDPAIRAGVAEAYRNGRGGALIDLPGNVGDAARAARREVPQVAAMDSLATALIRDVGERRRNVLRNVEDVYRQTQAASVARMLAANITRREASQAAWQGFTDQGVSSFTDRSGRVWRLTTYVEMAMRTVAMRAAVQGQVDQLTSMGEDLVVVSDEAGECLRCRPWEGKVLRITPGPTGEIQVESVTTGDLVTVDVAGSLAEAMLAGLLHPNCGHTIRVYLPGATRLPKGPTEDPDHHDAKDRQRAIEREIRKHKERKVAALTPEAEQAAAVKVRQWQAVMRQHLKDNPKLKRLPHREEIGAGNLPPGGKAPSPAGRLPGPPPPPKTTGAKATPKTDEARLAANQERQAAIDMARVAGHIAADFAELEYNSGNPDVLRERLDTLAQKARDDVSHGAPLPVGLDKLEQAAATGDAAKMRRAVATFTRANGITMVGKPGGRDKYDPSRHEAQGARPTAGAAVEVMRPGVSSPRPHHSRRRCWPYSYDWAQSQSPTRPARWSPSASSAPARSTRTR